MGGAGLDEDVALGEELEGLEGRAVGPDEPLPPLHEPVLRAAGRARARRAWARVCVRVRVRKANQTHLIPYHPRDFDYVAMHIILCHIISQFSAIVRVARLLRNDNLSLDQPP